MFWFLFLATKLLAFPSWVNYCGVQLKEDVWLEEVPFKCAFCPILIWQHASDIACVMREEYKIHGYL